MNNKDIYNSWVNSEYEAWDSKISDLFNDNYLLDFKNNSAIVRMLGCSIDIGNLFLDRINNRLGDFPWAEIGDFEKIGNESDTGTFIEVVGHKISGISLRYVYYADKILNFLEKNDINNIIEIGGGYGGICSILHILSKYRHIKIEKYSIYDLPNVQKIQNYYLDQIISKCDYGIQKIVFLDSRDVKNYNQTDDYCISFYALGEFDNEIQSSYIDNVISKINHGFILWNPPSRDTEQDDGLELIKKYHSDLLITNEDPSTSIRNLQLNY